MEIRPGPIKWNAVSSKQRSCRYCCMDAPTRTLTKCLEKKLDSNYTRMLWAILNKSWRQHPKKHQLYGHLHPITKIIPVRRTRHAGHCWRSRDELISYVLLWTPTYGRAKTGRSARTYIQQLCEDTGCSPEDLPEAMNDRVKWRERVRDIRAGSTTWWWWWYIYIYIYILKSAYLGGNLLFKQVFLKTMEYFIIFYFNLIFSRLLLIFLVSGYRW